jgi:hypothetical protein
MEGIKLHRVVCKSFAPELEMVVARVASAVFEGGDQATLLHPLDVRRGRFPVSLPTASCDRDMT